MEVELLLREGTILAVAGEDEVVVRNGMSSQNIKTMLEMLEKLHSRELVVRPAGGLEAEHVQEVLALLDEAGVPVEIRLTLLA